MINAGIFDGDQVLVKQQASASNGDIVVALVEDSATVKTFYKEDGYYSLQPENDSMDPILVHGDIQILGKDETTMNKEQEMVRIACKAIDDKKAIDIKVIDIHEVSVIADYFIIASGNNLNQVQAIVDM